MLFILIVFYFFSSSQKCRGNAVSGLEREKNNLKYMQCSSFSSVLLACIAIISMAASGLSSLMSIGSLGQQVFLVFIVLYSSSWENEKRMQS